MNTQRYEELLVKVADAVASPAEREELASWIADKPELQVELDQHQALRAVTVDAAWSPPTGVASSGDTDFSVPMAGVAVSWSWDPATRSYRRWQDGAPHLADGDVHLAADSVAVLTTEYVPSIVDARSPHPVTTGTGSAVVHRDGRAFPATWSRPTPYDPFVFRAPNGSEIPLDAGTTWLELAPG